MDQNPFEHLSYDAHEKHIAQSVQEQGGNPLARIQSRGTVDYWRHERMYDLLRPFIQEKDAWLTVGDGFGTDANWLLSQGADATASDISDHILKAGKEQGYIQKFSKENAEKISFADNSFSYVLCKEAYHHFPRPYIAAYEMIRVANKAIILIEPVDIMLQMPAILWLKNMLDRFDVNAINKIWKNRYSFETVGNYVYKVSEREIEKMAMGINLPAIAFKGVNDYHSAALDLNVPVSNTATLNKVKSKIRFRDFLSKIGLLPYQLSCCVVFKTMPDAQVQARMKELGYKFIELAKNPYVSSQR